MFNKKQQVNKEDLLVKNTLKKYVSVSILDIDVYNIANILKQINNSKAYSIHYDVMDGNFVSNISFGNMFLEKIAGNIEIPIEIHLMVNDPILQYKNYVNFAKTIYIHFESLYYREITNALLDIKNRNIRAGLTIKPKTNIEQIYEFLEYCDEVMIMTVEPGKGSQSFLTSCLQKIEKLSIYLRKNNLNVIISVDGGINDKTAKLAYKHGANKFISGNYIINNKDLTIHKAIDSLF